MDFSNEPYSSNPLVENEDYYMDTRGFRVMTNRFLKERGYCCGNGCKHCPYFPKHHKGNREIKN